jgi:hypothetical protein
MLAPKAAAAGDLVVVAVSVHVEASAGDSEAVEVSADLVGEGLEVGSVAGEASVVELQLMAEAEAHLVAALKPPLQLNRRLPILSRTSRHLEENAAQSSTFAM